MPERMVNSTVPTVWLSTEVQSGLCELAFQIFTTRPGEVGESIGILIGEPTAEGMNVREFAELTSGSIEDLMAKYPGHIAGLFRLVGHGGFSPCENDLASWRFLFPDRRSVFLIAKPVSVNRAEGVAWLLESGQGTPVKHRLMLKGREIISSRRMHIMSPPSRPTEREVPAEVPAQAPSTAGFTSPPAPLAGREPLEAPVVSTPFSHHASFPAATPRMLAEPERSGGGWAMRGIFIGILCGAMVFGAYRYGNSFRTGAAPVEVPAVAEKSVPKEPVIADVSPEINVRLTESGPGLIFSWDLTGAPSRAVSNARIVISEGGRDRVVDVTREFKPRGTMAIRPADKDIAVTLRALYQGQPPITGTARFAGFVVRPVEAVEQVIEPSSNSHDSETLRRRIRELEDANAALRRHVFGWENTGRGATKAQ